METARLQEAAVRKVTQDLNALGEQVSHEKLVDLVMSYHDNDEYIQAFVGLVHPALDYTFYQMLSEQADQAKNKKDRRKARQVRDRILELTQAVEDQSRAAAEQATGLLREILESENVEQAVRQRVPMIDDMFMAVLQANLDAAQKQNNPQAVARLQAIQETVMQIIMESSPPEIRFINELLQIEDPLEARLKLVNEAGQYGPALLQTMTALIEQMQQRSNEPVAQRLAELRQEVEKVLEA
jgi:hypothetical protein